MNTFEAVVARYEEDVSWVRALTMPTHVYNKGVSSTGLEDKYKIAQLKNVGRESETYLHHIIKHYDTLPDYLVFLQGNPFDHCHGILEILKNPPTFDFALPLTGNTKHESLNIEYNWPGFKECLAGLASLIGIGQSTSLIYGTGAQYIVPRRAILMRPKEFYEMLREKVAYEVNPLEGWAMERLWGYLFGYRNRTDELTLDTIVPGDYSALLRAQDLVCVHTDQNVFIEESVRAASNVFYQKKYSTPTEEDPCIFFDGGFLTHKHILLLYWRDTFQPLTPQVFQSFGVPTVLLA